MKAVAEAFQANPVTGSGSIAIPLEVTAARGLEPKLALRYDSGSGNGPYGLGWSIGLGAISRKTDKGLPRYVDGADSDTFVLSDAEDLVPLLIEDPPGTWSLDERDDGDFRVRRYRPRVEGAFSRIERYVDTGTGEVHWRVRDRGNVLHIYGRTAASRVSDPADASGRRVFSWLLDEVVDDRGNRIVIEYARDDRGAGGEAVSSEPYDRARKQGLSPFVQLYPRRILYGSASAQEPFSTSTGFLFQLVFDWGDLDDRAEATGTTGGRRVPLVDLKSEPPTERADAFSHRRAGFEIRTRWRCDRIVLFHAIKLSSTPPELQPLGESGGAWLPVSSWHLRYDDASHLAKLLGVTKVGWRSRPGSATPPVTDALAMPEVTFTYSEARLGGVVEVLGSQDHEPVPRPVDGRLWRFADLDGEGLPGLLTEQGAGWYYKRNHGDPALRAVSGRAWFGGMQAVGSLPSMRFADGASLTDVDGDGRLELVTRGTGVAGTWSRTSEGRWTSFRPFRCLPNLDWNDAALRMVDLTGDGLADVLLLHNRKLDWWPSDGSDGFGPPSTVRTGTDETTSPVILSANDTEAIFLADMTGDGLSDVVRVRASSVCYWPNLGYGLFGPKVEVGNAPKFPRPFVPGLVHLADVDGSGTADLIYCGAQGALWARNRSGNTFGDAEPIRGVPPLTNTDHVETVDLLGDGTSCLVWSKDLSTQAPRFVRLMADGKPHLLTGVDYGTGATVELSYAPSTRFYVDDRAAGRPWATRLPFPVQCLERMVVTDHAREHALTTRYAYHHGYFEGVERAFRGFGCVEQWDSELVGVEHVEPHVPVRTVTWFHVGAWFEQASLEEKYAATEWFKDDSQAMTVEPNRITAAGALTTAERREAARALKGRVLRQEIWRDDGTTPAAPYVVKGTAYETRPLQPRRPAKDPRGTAWGRDDDVPGSFLVVDRATLTVAYDERPTDPRTTHQLVLEADRYGTPVLTAAVAYGRRGVSAEDNPEQGLGRVVTTRNSVVHDDGDAGRLRLAVPWQMLRREVGGLTFPSSGSVATAWTVASLNTALAAVTSHLGPHAPTPSSSAWTRLIGLQAQRYANLSSGDALDFGAVGDLALPYDVRTLVMTTELLAAADEDVDGTGLDVRAGWTSADRDTALSEEGGYDVGSSWAGLTTLQALAESLAEDPEDAEEVAALVATWWDPPAGAVWAPSGSTTYDTSSTGFKQPVSQTDPFGTVATIDWDDHHLRPETVSVPLSTATGAPVHTVSATYDAHTLQPVLVSDINESRTAIAFDALGRVVKSVTLGRTGETVDDEDHPTVAFDYTFASHTGSAWTPPSAHATMRRTHWNGASPDVVGYDETWVYFDGLGRELMTKAKAAPGIALLLNEDGTPDLDEENHLQYGEVDPRFVASGRVVLDAKGNPVKQYEPYFSSISGWEPDATAAMQGVTPILHYDPVGRVVRTDYPDGTYERVERTPWVERHFDRNDTIPTVPDVDFETEVAAGTWTWPDPFEDPEVEALWAPVRAHAWLLARAVADTDAGAAPPITEERAAELRRSVLQAYSVRDTPTVLHVDVLGRPYLEQRTKSSAKDSGGGYPDTTGVHVTLDVLGRVVKVAARYVPEGETASAEQLATTDVFDLLGRSLCHVRRDAQKKVSGVATGGTSWVLAAVDGKPVRRWDSRDTAFWLTYDALRRPVGTYVKVGSAAETLQLLVRYGEYADDAQARRLYGQPWRANDNAGLVLTKAVDVDGRVTESTRRFVEQYFPVPDWSDMLGSSDVDDDDPDDGLHPGWVKVPHDSGTSSPANEVFTQTAVFDVTGRPVQDAVYRNAAHEYERRYTYDAGGRLTGVEVRLQSDDDGDWRPVVHDVTYNARGQRVSVVAGDDGETSAGSTLDTAFTYDDQTFRLLRLRSKRSSDDVVLEDYRWVHDAVGNVTFQESSADDTVWYDNVEVTPHRTYTYDALDRLVQATGREHDSTYDMFAGGKGQTNAPYGTGPTAHKADGTALRAYTQTYEYDDVGNFTSLSHDGGTGHTFVRTYAYTPGDDGALFNNQLVSTSIGSTNYPLSYDEHGNTTSMSNLFDMAWDPFDRLASVQTQARSQDTHPDPDRAPAHDWFYVYDAGGQRVRKVRATLVEYDHAGDPGVLVADGVARGEERFYVGPFEVWRKYNGDGTTDTERETLHIMDDQRRVAMVETLTWDADAAIGSGSLVNLWRYQLDDHLGTSVGEVDETGLEIGWEEYHPYGTTALWSFDNTREVSGKRYRYTGMERDDETTLHYHNARYYDPSLARWTAVDRQIRGGRDLSAYAYCSSSPIARSDRNGEADGPEAAMRDLFYELLQQSGADIQIVHEVPIRVMTDEGGNILMRVDDIMRVGGREGHFAVEFKAYVDPVEKAFVWTGGQLVGYPALAKGSDAAVLSKRVANLDLPKHTITKLEPLLVHLRNLPDVAKALEVFAKDEALGRKLLREAGALIDWGKVAKLGKVAPGLGLLLLVPDAKAAWDTGGPGKLAVFVGVQAAEEIPWVGTSAGLAEAASGTSYTDKVWAAINDPAKAWSDLQNWVQSKVPTATPEERRRDQQRYDDARPPAGAHIE